LLKENSEDPFRPLYRPHADKKCAEKCYRSGVVSAFSLSLCFFHSANLAARLASLSFEVVIEHCLALWGDVALLPSRSFRVIRRLSRRLSRRLLSRHRSLSSPTQSPIILGPRPRRPLTRLCASCSFHANLVVAPHCRFCRRCMRYSVVEASTVEILKGFSLSETESNKP
jgi:hypothetical protein